MSSKYLLEVKDLSIVFGTGKGEVTALEGVHLQLMPGETLGVVGESGSGKSLTSLAIMGLLPPAAQVRSGEIVLHTQAHSGNVLSMTPRALRSMRGKTVSMIFQEPMTSLNPVHKCGHQVRESLLLHEGLGKASAKKRVLELFEQVKLPDPARIFEAYPHQLSGGQKQRVMIAMALSCSPALIIADEPTTALDVTVQQRILELLRDLCSSRGTGLLFITHDLGVVAGIAQRVTVMHRGKVVEQGLTAEVLYRPRAAYTKALLACRPPLDSRPHRLAVVEDFLSDKPRTDAAEALRQANDLPAPRKQALLTAEGLEVWYPADRDWKGQPTAFTKALQHVSLTVLRGETLGLVGESGCGKSTLGKALVKLQPLHSGTINYAGKRIDDLSARAFRPYRRMIQLIFQDPYAALNPRMSVGQTLEEPLLVYGLAKNAAERRARAADLLDKVGLASTALVKYPHQFSGGQRQRICIARALAVEPEFIICDESVSALDVSVQAQVLNLLNDLKEELGLTYIFISHDLSVVKYMSDRIAVMRKGKLLEIGSADDIYHHPTEEYTRQLIEAVPKL